ncbi:MAG: tRNA (N6-isopentenyl adenosine(37)-C2)-methylthiotransferase MiaB [Bacteroidales bacterium]|jgi:tRNA-2-methylthio-N6-dimethylallyladenosine synthase|nr:tRNA (N6-isopentenyl adenosine(37)-C2)-methylthiotransferase MiaB [Bacteroidales bacterium]
MKKLFIETYGCQMNFADSEILVSILADAGYIQIDDYKQADLILVNTCSIRDHAEQRVFNRLTEFVSLKKRLPHVKVGIVGCMAERLKEQLLDLSVDLVVGPDAYRSLPSLLEAVDSGEKGINVVLSEVETYDDIVPVRTDTNGVTAFISIMRGCENFCAYCVVPYTRGKERSRSADTIVSEAKSLFEQGFRDITLLGQNVNSYKYDDVDFPDLIQMVASVNPLLRVRFATSHPKDISDKLLQVIAKHENICKSIHLPVQSGSNNMLKKMNRKYTREWYLERIAAIRNIISGCTISTDIIAGFCSETEDDHLQTLSLMREVGYSSAFMFKYSERPDTFAAKNYKDDVPEDVKLRRLNEIIDLQRDLSLADNKKEIGLMQEILIEGASHRNSLQSYGRTSQNKVVVFDNPSGLKAGEYAHAKILRCTPATLIGEIVIKTIV